MNRYYLKIALIFACVSIIGCNQEKEKLSGLDIRLFKDGPAWELAKAVQSEDTIKIKKIISEHTVSVDYQEPKFGETLLLWAVWANHYKSSKVLLECGADPNLQDNSNGNSAFIYAADKFETSTYLKLLLAYKGDVNAVTKNDSTNILCTPLITAAYHRLESVKLLIDAGADINYTAKNFKCALGSAFTFKKVDIVSYLLIDKKADYKRSFGKTIDGKDIIITDMLRHWVFPLNSDSYRKKMEIVAYLKKQGVDYTKAPIPEHYLKNYPKEFLDKY